MYHRYEPRPSAHQGGAWTARAAERSRPAACTVPSRVSTRRTSSPATSRASVEDLDLRHASKGSREQPTTIARRTKARAPFATEEAPLRAWAKSPPAQPTPNRIARV